MKITQIFNLLICFVCFSCDRTSTSDSYQNASKSKEDSLKRAQFLAYTDSMQKMYASIKVPRHWTAIQNENKMTANEKSKETLLAYKIINIDISTAYQVDLICFSESGDSEIFNINSVVDNADSVIFNTSKNSTNERMQWVLKIADNAQISGQWSAYNQDKKKFVGTGQYHSLNEE